MMIGRWLTAAALAAALGGAAAPARAQTLSEQNLHILDGNRNPQQEHCWAVADGSLACGFVLVDPSTGNPYSPSNPIAATPTDCGGTIAVGGTAQNAAGADAARKTMLIENPVTATEDLYVAVAGAATVAGAGDFADLAPGGSATMTLAGTVIQSAVSVNAATTGHRFLCTYTR